MVIGIKYGFAGVKVSCNLTRWKKYPTSVLVVGKSMAKKSWNLGKFKWHAARVGCLNFCQKGDYYWNKGGLKCQKDIGIRARRGWYRSSITRQKFIRSVLRGKSVWRGGKGGSEIAKQKLADFATVRRRCDSMFLVDQIRTKFILF